MNEDMLRKLFKYFNLFMVFMWKLGLEKLLNVWPKGLGQYIVITHYGRKSGKKYFTPVNYCKIDGEIYCSAGFGVQSDWYRNIVHNPSIEIWTKDGWWIAEAEEISDHPERISIMRNVLIGSGFAAYLFGLNPSKMDDEVLDEMTRDYCLLKLKRVSPQTGNDGPGEFSWIWPVLTFVFFFMLTNRKKKK